MMLKSNRDSNNPRGRFPKWITLALLSIPFFAGSPVIYIVFQGVRLARISFIIGTLLLVYSTWFFTVKPRETHHVTLLSNIIDSTQFDCPDV